jgi:hypothetical protein
MSTPPDAQGSEGHCVIPDLLLPGCLVIIGACGAFTDTFPYAELGRTIRLTGPLVDLPLGNTQGAYSGSATGTFVVTLTPR